VIILRILVKNAGFLFFGFFSAIAALVAMRAWAGEPWFQPQSDFGILIGAALVAIYVVVKDLPKSLPKNLRDSNGNPHS
jgi:hypothetical protein